MTQRRPWPPHSSRFYITQRRTTAGRTHLDGTSARRIRLDNTRHSQETDINAAGGIRTRNPSKRSAAQQQPDIRRNIAYSATLASSVTQHRYLRPETTLNPVLLENVVQFCICREICSACLSQTNYSK